MSYTKQNFASGDILTAEALNKMDDQISSNESKVSELSEEIVDLKNNSVSVTYDASTKTLNISSGSGG